MESAIPSERTFQEFGQSLGVAVILTKRRRKFQSGPGSVLRRRPLSNVSHLPCLMKTICKSLLLLLLAASGAQAFPPAPYYTLYGIVRNQVGEAISAEGAQIILLKGGVEVGRTPVNSVQAVDQNYELSVKIDQNRTGTTLYTDKAVTAEGPFSIAVEMNGARFYPIEVTGNLTAGKGAERVRLDLNLGEDTDHDGL